MVPQPSGADSKRLQKPARDEVDAVALIHQPTSVLSSTLETSRTPPDRVESVVRTPSVLFGVRDEGSVSISTHQCDLVERSPDLATNCTEPLLPHDAGPALYSLSAGSGAVFMSQRKTSDENDDSQASEDGETVSGKDKSWLCGAFSSFFLCSLNRREKLIVLSVAIVDLTSYMCLSIMAPFFPIEASHRGVSATVSGWIFAVFGLVQFLASPLFGKILPRIGSRLMISSAQFISGVFVVLFGFLDAINNYVLFSTLCMLLRILQAFSCTASETSCFAVLANVFPTQTATALGIMETAIGLGMMIGPAIGGILYQIGGFRLPFFLLGGSMMLVVPVLFRTLPERDDGSQSRTETISLLEILRIPTVIVMCLAIITAALVWSLFDPILAPHLEKFDVSPAVLGLLFLLVSTFYCILSPVFGGLADRVVNCPPMLVCGFLALSFSLLLLGPSPWLGFKESDNYMWLNIVSLALLGMSESLAIVPTFNKILDGIEKAGYEISFAMFSAVSGIWGSCYALGDSIGPALGGWLADRDGFPRCLSYVAVVCLAQSILILIQWQWDKHHGRHVTLVNRGSSVPLDHVSENRDSTTTMMYSSLCATPLLTKRGVAEAAVYIQRHTRVLPHNSDYIPMTLACRLN